jgi:hypothetical protein
LERDCGEEIAVDHIADVSVEPAMNPSERWIGAVGNCRVFFHDPDSWHYKYNAASSR